MIMRRLIVLITLMLIASACAAPISQPDSDRAHTRSDCARAISLRTSAPKPRPSAQPAAKAPTNNRGSDATQSMTFAVPAHPIDVILGRPTQNSITASVLAYQDAEGYIEYGTTRLRQSDVVAIVQCESAGGCGDRFIAT